ncbi:MAG: TonB-dependent receptor [Chitinophagales bacterium]|nr:TonB-dependent receptor [Chitinophagales bacterium]
MNKTVLICLISLGYMPNLVSQTTFSIQGKVTMEDHSELQDGIVSLFLQRDSSLYRTTLIDSMEIFFLDQLNPDIYMLKIQANGAEDNLIYNLAIKENKILREIVLKRRMSKSLATVQISGTSSFVQKKIDRLVVNPNAILSNAGLTAFEVLSKSPGISIDMNDNITVRGKQGVLIFIDDKPTYMSSADIANYLKSLPASSIATIEIITAPPAKYDAAGNAGIINIKQKKNSTKGYSGALSLSYGQGFYARTNNSLNLNYRINKWNFYSIASYSETNFYQDLTIKRNYYDSKGSLASAFNQNSFLKIEKDGTNLKLGADYYLSKKSTFGFSVNGFLNKDIHLITNESKIYNDQREVVQLASAQNPSDRRFRNLSFNLNYQLKLDSMGKELSLNTDYLRYDSRHDQNLFSVFRRPDFSFISQSNLVSDLPANINIYSAKADYLHPINSSIKIEAGSKASSVQTENIANFFDEVNSIRIKNELFSNDFSYKENILAGYLNFNIEKNNWSIQSGLRAENTSIKGVQKGNSVNKDSSFIRNYLSWFPTFYFSYNLDSMKYHTLGFSYGRRIDRPDYQSMNPFTYPLDRFTLYSGNPFLNPSFTHNLELSYNYKGVITAAVFYSSVEDMITETIETGSNIFYSRPGNIGKQKVLGMSIDGGIPITKWWTLQFHSELVYSQFRANLYNIQLDNSGTYWQIAPTNQFQLPNKWSAEISGSYQTSAPSGQFVIIPAGMVNIALAKKLYNDRLTIKASLNDVFFTFQPGGEIKGLNNSDASWLSYLDTRVFNLSASYRFKEGKALAARKQSAAEAERARVKL